MLSLPRPLLRALCYSHSLQVPPIYIREQVLPTHHVEAELARSQPPISSINTWGQAVWIFGVATLISLSNPADIAQEKSQLFRRTPANCKSSAEATKDQLDYKWNPSRVKQAAWYLEEGQGLCSLSQTKGWIPNDARKSEIQTAP